MATFDPETILSAFNDRGTLLLFLKAILKRLEEFSVDAENITSPAGTRGSYLMADGTGGCTWDTPSIPRLYLAQFDIPNMPGPGDTHLSSAVLSVGKTVLTVYANGYAEADFIVSQDGIGSGKFCFTGFSYSDGLFNYETCTAVYWVWDSFSEVSNTSFQHYQINYPQESPPDITISEYRL